MRRFAVVALLALVATHALAQEDLPDDFDTLNGGKPLGSTDSSCSAFSNLEILVTAGRCRGRATANCNAVSEAMNDYQQAYEEWWIGDDGEVDTNLVCDGERVQAAAVACARAIARVWTDAIVKVDCDGQGFACGYAIADGEAFAVAFAEALAVAAADAGSEGVNGWCVADIRAISGALARAAESARAQACSEGLPAEDFESNYAGAVVNAIATAFAEASAFVCNDDGAQASSDCFGEATAVIDTIEDTGASGTGGTQVEQQLACEGNKAVCCTSEFDTRRFCNCDNCNGPLRLQTREDASTGTLTSWQDRSDDICFCP